MSNAVREIHQCQCAVCATASDERVVRYHRQINLLLSRLNEPQRRWYVGVLSQEPDSSGDVQLSLITGLDEKTIHRGRHELQAELLEVPLEQERHGGGGRPLSEKKTQR
jgi:hypothetical protein